MNLLKKIVKLSLWSNTPVMNFTFIKVWILKSYCQQVKLIWEGITECCVVRVFISCCNTRAPWMIPGVACHPISAKKSKALRSLPVCNVDTHSLKAENYICSVFWLERWQELTFKEGWQASSCSWAVQAPRSWKTFAQ